MLLKLNLEMLPSGGGVQVKYTHPKCINCKYIDKLNENYIFEIVDELLLPAKY